MGMQLTDCRGQPGTHKDHVVITNRSSAYLLQLWEHIISELTYHTNLLRRCVRPVRLILGIPECDLTAGRDFKYVTIRDGVVDYSVGHQGLVPEDGEFVDRGKFARHVSENLGRYEEGMVRVVGGVIAPDPNAGILLPVIPDVEWLLRVLFTSDFGYTYTVESGLLAHCKVGK